MERPRIVHAVFVPTLDLIWNQCGFFKCQPVEQRMHFRGRGGIRQALVCNPSDDLMS